MRRLSIAGVGASLLIFMLTGCGSNSTPAPIVNPPTAQSRLQEIQNNPNMPPQAKAAALAAIQSRGNTHS